MLRAQDSLPWFQLFTPVSGDEYRPLERDGIDPEVEESVGPDTQLEFFVDFSDYAPFRCFTKLEFATWQFPLFALIPE